MHTSALIASYTGVLLERPEVRTQVLDHDGTSVPVLCVHLELENALHNHVHAQQYFPAGHHAQCHAAAHRLKKGQRITIDMPLISHEIKGVAAHIHTHKDPTPCPA